MPMPQADKTIPAPPAAPPPAVEQESFVINLCSSTTPMALTQPQLAELKRYSFFVSRRLEDGRERFRLHMGYFDSLLQAEELLPVVREIYPGAWAGEAPGKRLRARSAAGNPPPAPTPSVPAAPTAAAGPSAELLANMPTLSAAPDLNPPPPPPVAPPAVLELVPQPARVPPPAPVTLPAPPAAAAAAVPAAAAPPRAATAPAARAGSAKRAASMPFDQRSNVREVLNSLDEPARKPSAPEAPPANPPVGPVGPVGPVVRQPGVLPESQVLHLLEEKRGDPLNTTSTPAAFSIQLQWSVQAIDLAKVPPLAIFGAYTLYTVEGSREGRRWFGLRLGFFSDANSAKTGCAVRALGVFLRCRGSRQSQGTRWRERRERRERSQWCARAAAAHRAAAGPER